MLGQRVLYFVLFLLALVQAIRPPCSCSSGGRVRKSANDLTKGEWKDFLEALKTLYNNGTIDELSRIHEKYSDETHGNIIFLAWHRCFLLEFEEALMSVNRNVTVPYMDWTLISQAPEKSRLFSDELFGGNGRSRDNCVVNGFFADVELKYPEPKCIRRKYDGRDGDEDTMSSFIPPEALIDLIHNEEFEAFATDLEGGPHAVVHTAFGGDMTQMYSPNDAPIFFTNHSEADKTWYDYQKYHPSKATEYYGKDHYGHSVSPDYILPYFDVPISHILHPDKLCYSYQPSRLSEVTRALVPKDLFTDQSDYKDDNYLIKRHPMFSTSNSFATLSNFPSLSNQFSTPSNPISSFSNPLSNLPDPNSNPSDLISTSHSFSTPTNPISNPSNPISTSLDPLSIPLNPKPAASKSFSSLFNPKAPSSNSVSTSFDPKTTSNSAKATSSQSFSTLPHSVSTSSNSFLSSPDSFFNSFADSFFKDFFSKQKEVVHECQQHTQTMLKTQGFVPSPNYYDRSNECDLRLVKPIPDDWLDKMNLDKNRVHAYFKRVNKLITKINQRTDYYSPSILKFAVSIF